MPLDRWDVPMASYNIAIIGGGNAALCAAITAAETGARVIILEAAPKTYRGGNSLHTRNFQCMHYGPLSPLVDSYSDEEYFADLLKVTCGETDGYLAGLAIRRSEECLPWMEERGDRPNQQALTTAWQAVDIRHDAINL
jgi:tricarballylate dehydrogenase